MEATNLISGDMVRYVASYGVDVAHPLSLCCKSFYESLKEYIPKEYGHLPISKKEIVEYIMYTIDEINKKVKTLKKTRKRAMYYFISVHKPNSYGFTDLIKIKIHPGAFFRIEIRIHSCINLVSDRKINTRRLFKHSIGEVNMKILREDVIYTVNNITPFDALQWSLPVSMWIYQRRGRCPSMDPAYPLKMSIGDIFRHIHDIKDFHTLGISFRDIIRPSSNDKCPRFEHMDRIGQNYPEIACEMDNILLAANAFHANRKVGRQMRILGKEENIGLYNSTDYELIALYYFISFSLGEL